MYTSALSLKQPHRPILIRPVPYFLLEYSALVEQASATRYLDLDPEASPNLYEVFMGTQQAPLAIRQTKHNVDVLSSHVLMAAIEEALEPGDEITLSDLIMF